MKIVITILGFWLGFTIFICNHTFAQTGTDSEPVRYLGGETANPNNHDGGLRYAVGVENIQVMRANRTQPELADGFGWTYSHAPNLTYFNNTFYLQYLSNPVNEHEAPGQTFIVSSKDGRNWDNPKVLFPPYVAPEGVTIPEGYQGYMMHQRMGFYRAPNGKLLSLAFYGHTENPFHKGGIGRVVREIDKDGGFGPIYFIRYSSHTNWKQENTAFPFYTDSNDKEFIVACDALLADRLRTLQWWDEDKGLDGFYNFNDTTDRLQALSYYHRKDGKVVGLWKWSYATLSEDNGYSWSDAVKVSTLTMAGGKVWGQRTNDGRFAITYNPIATQEYRYPLVVISGDDGILFDNMGIVHGEVPPRRYFGRWKDFGPCYMRGIVEGESIPNDNNMWLTYSVNKEDIWISRIPLPIKVEVRGNITDNFNSLPVGAAVPEWNIYSPRWAKISIDNFPTSKNRSLKLEDEDPYDYAKAVRVFEMSQKVKIAFKIYVDKTGDGTLQFEVNDRHGNRPIRFIFDKDGILKVDNGVLRRNLVSYEFRKWHSIEIDVTAEGMGSFDLVMNGKKLLAKEPLVESVKSVERITFRTGDYRNLPNRSTPNQVPSDPLLGADHPVEKAIYYIDEVSIVKL